MISVINSSEKSDNCAYKVGQRISKIERLMKRSSRMNAINELRRNFVGSSPNICLFETFLLCDDIL